MSERRTIGQILTGLGRITDEDVAVALEHQRDRGGFFGEALIARGVITQGELDFGIASQFDLPYVVPDPESIDLSVASMVSAEWALIHNMLPIVKAADELMVVTDSPLKDEAIAHLEAISGCAVSLSLSSPVTVRETIRQVYAMASASDEEVGPPVDLSEAVGIVLLMKSQRFGISVRGARARFWWEDNGVVRRRPLSGDWRRDLDRSLSPSWAERTGDGPRSRWEAQLTSSGTVVRVAVDSLADESGRELLLIPMMEPESPVDRFSVPPDGVVAEIRLLARSGAARFIVQSDPDELSKEALAHLPELVLDPSWRSVYIHTDVRGAADETFSVHMPNDPATWAHELAALRSFDFDVVTVDLSSEDHGWAAGALDVASVAFLYWPAGEDTKAAYEAGVRWLLKIERGGDEVLNWSLEALSG
jgi:hypothetical protein